MLKLTKKLKQALTPDIIEKINKYGMCCVYVDNTKFKVYRHTDNIDNWGYIRQAKSQYNTPIIKFVNN
jgi:hypothetical protein